MRKIWLAIFLLCFSVPALAIGVTTVTLVMGAAWVTANTVAAMAIAMAINMVVSMVVSKAFANDSSFDMGASGSSPNPGNRQQVAPATDNKLPVVYGSSYVGGIVTDLSISENNQEIYYVLAISEVTNTNPSQTPDNITFGDIYFGGKRVTFQGNGYTVASLTDESTGVVDTTVNGRIEFYLYNNGSNSPVNSSKTAIEVMQTSGLTYTWDSTKLMTNCSFAIMHLSYSQSANIRGLEQTKFQITNSRSSTGDCFYDYLINTRYGCAIDSTQIDTTSLAALTAYSNENFPYIDANGNAQAIPRFSFNGLLETSRTVLQNLQDMATCCDCLIKYNEITAKWGVIVQKPDYVTIMDINDSNMISAISITPLDIASSYNVIECKFPDESNQDAFNSSTFDLAEVAPSLLYPNEPVNKVSLSLPLVNNDVTAQYVANRVLKAGREDLQMQVTIGFTGVQLESGDIVAVTSLNYGWTDKPFRINKVIQQFNDDGSIGVQLNMSEYNATVYDDVLITQFQPAPNTGIGDPTFFGIPSAPTVVAQYPVNTNPLFVVQVVTSPAGITQYAEVWYSAYSNPLQEQMYFAGTSEIQSNGTPWSTSFVLPNITLANIPAGDWYLFSRMVNSLASSAYSPASTILRWRPSTFQYTDKYLVVAYADAIDGTGFDLDPRGHSYYGLLNQDNVTPSLVASDYTWYLADPTFGTTIFLCYSNRTGRKFSFDTGFAGYAASTGAFVPTQASLFDSSIWSALPDGNNYIDLDHRTGQLLETGTTTVGTGEIAVTNNPDGKIVASLKQYLDFGTGVYQRTQSAATITVDIYGRVVGFEAPDDFYYTDVDFTATSGQTVFTVTRGIGYIVGNCWVLQNGCWLEPTEYTDASGSVTLDTGANVGDIITVISFKSVSNVSVATSSTSGTGTVATLGFANRAVAPFQVGQSITVAGVNPTGYNGTYTVTACDTASVSYANTTTGSMVTGGTIEFTDPYYNSFSINTVDLVDASSYTTSGFTITSGYELLFLNGTLMNELDYDIIGQTITNFPSILNGKLTVLQWTPNNLGLPSGNCVNAVTNTIIGQTTYPFSYDVMAFNLYANGVMYQQEVDYTTGVGGYTLAVTPDTILTTLVNQTFARTGAV